MAGAVASKSLLFAAPAPLPPRFTPFRPAGPSTTRVAARPQPLALILAVIPRSLCLVHVGLPRVLPHEPPEPGSAQLEGGQGPLRGVK